MTKYQTLNVETVRKKIAQVAIFVLVFSLLTVVIPNSTRLISAAQATTPLCPNDYKSDFGIEVTGSDTTYVISVPESLTALSQNPTYWNCKFRLSEDIDMANGVFSPIGDINNRFTGIFDGGGKTIRNIRIQQALGGTGLFGVIDSATISNLKMESVTALQDPIDPKDNIAALVGAVENSSILRDVHLESITISSIRSSVGAIVGYANSDLEIVGCSVKNSSISGFGSVGGILGIGDNGRIVISNCGVRNIQVGENLRDEGTPGLVGGIAGFVGDSYPGNLTNLSIESITVTSLGSNVGGVTGGFDGLMDSVTVKVATVTTESYNAGGVVGQLFEGSITNVQVELSTISGVNEIGGLAGLNDGTIESVVVQNSIVGVESSVRVGGVTGRNSGTLLSVTVSKSTIKGHSEVGGISGIHDGTIKWSRVHDSDSISASSLVGGIAGATGPNAVIEQTALAGTSQVYGNSKVGGISGYNLGYLANVVVTKSVTISGTSLIGGITGENQINLVEGAAAIPLIINSYSMANLIDLDFNPNKEDRSVGLLVGTTDTAIVSSFALALPSPSTLGFLPTSPAISLYLGDEERLFESSKSLTSIELRESSVFDSAGWDISSSSSDESIWVICPSINDGYPALRWMYVDDSCGTNSGGGGGDSGPPAAPAVQPVIPQTSSISSPTQLEVVKGESLIVFGVFSSPITNISLNSTNLPSTQWVQTYGTVTVGFDPNLSGLVQLQIFNGQVPLLPVVFVTFVDKKKEVQSVSQETATVQTPTQETSSAISGETSTSTTGSTLPTRPVSETPVVTTPTVPDTSQEPGTAVLKKPVLIGKASVSFLTSSSTLDSAARRSIRTFASSIKGLEISSILITGFTSDTRTNPNRRALALARARSVGAELLRAGISADIRYRDGGNQKGAGKGQVARIQVRGLE